MKRLSGNLIGVGLVALAASVVGVGVVWAGSSALFGADSVGEARVSTADSSVPADDTPDGDLPPVPPDGDQPDVPPGDPGNSDELDELRQIVSALSDQVEALAATVAASVDKVETLEKNVASVVSEFDDLDSRVNKGLVAIERVTDDVAAAKQDAADALSAVNGLSATVGVIERRTTKLGEDGNYSGPINPSQFTRRLTTSDVTGNWPLNRVSEKLRTDNLEVYGSGCSADYRFNTVLVVNAFRWVECVRIAK